MTGLVHHSDKGGQYLAVRYTQRLADAGAVASVGSTGDSYDCEHFRVAAVAVRPLLRPALRVPSR